MADIVGGLISEGILQLVMPASVVQSEVRPTGDQAADLIHGGSGNILS